MFVTSKEARIDKFARECSRGELSESLAAGKIEDLIAEAYAAGEAAMRERCKEKLAPLISRLHALCLDFDARELDDVKHEIWNAVAGDSQ